MENNDARFWAKVDKTGPVVVEELGECWVWTGNTRAGYGMIREDWSVSKNKMYSAHRLSWAWANRVEYPDRSVVIRHRCDNPPCVRPDHLEPGSGRDNNHDKMKRDRGFSLLTNALVAEARDRARSGESIHSIIKDMPEGVSVFSLAQAVRGCTFPYAPAEPVAEPDLSKQIFQKLTEQDYREIIAELAKPVQTMLGKDIAKKYGVHPSLITRIKKDTLKTIKRASFE